MLAEWNMNCVVRASLNAVSLPLKHAVNGLFWLPDVCFPFRDGHICVRSPYANVSGSKVSLEWLLSNGC